MSLEARHVRPAREPQDDRRGPVKNRWALLVGVNEFVDPAFARLKYCVNDVLALGEMLEGQGYTVVTLHDGAAERRLLPTRDNVEAELLGLCEVAQEDDLLWAHFSCHGSLVGGQRVLITRDTRQKLLAKRGLPVDLVQGFMRESKASRLVLTLDACHAGTGRGEAPEDEFVRNVHELAEGFALLAASTSQQEAQEWAEKEHGVFSYHLLSGLSGEADRNGKGFVTADDLHAHTLDGLRRWSVKTGNRIQLPTREVVGLGDMILAYVSTAPEPVWKQIGIEMVRIPAGEFLYGEEEESVYLPEYWMSKTPVTNTQYRALVDAEGRRPPTHWTEGRIPDGKENHPVVNVSWHEAQAFCRWAGYRLPTEREWEKGARGTDGRAYPWGNGWKDGRSNTREAGVMDTTPVNQYPDGTSPYGLLHMAGNVWELCEDWFDERRNYRVLRGGSFGISQWVARCAFRFRDLPSSRYGDVGFRVVVGT